MIETVTKADVLTILDSHYADATPEAQSLIAIMKSEVRDAPVAGHVGERNAHMDKMLEESGFE